ncbi:NAD(P)-dependent oxidoreductase [Streptomyces sp. NPDC015127]|uniref:NAD(P)-dependent oxidoreductase n=1 Tax=Streptomyces sp. NPDC015127 TaxID=3364939 RepID=UPI003702F336
MTVFGAAGNVGRRTVTEALSRGHEVTAVVRDPARFAELPRRARPHVADAADPDAVARASAGQDLVIGATRPAPGRERELVATTEALLAGVARTGVRLLLVGGAASLTLPGKGALTLAEGPDFPVELGAIAAACTAQLDVCRAAGAGADWTYLSPPALLEPGVRTGGYRLGGDELLVDGEGRSFISMEDFAVALLEEAERPRHRRTRFTVAY